MLSCPFQANKAQVVAVMLASGLMDAVVRDVIGLASFEGGKGDGARQAGQVQLFAAPGWRLGCFGCTLGGRRCAELGMVPQAAEDEHSALVATITAARQPCNLHAVPTLRKTPPTADHVRGDSTAAGRVADGSCGC